MPSKALCFYDASLIKVLWLTSYVCCFLYAFDFIEAGDVKAVFSFETVFWHHK